MRTCEVAFDVTKLNALKRFSLFFKQGEAERLARETGFILRSSSRLTGEAFLKMMVHIPIHSEWSLSDQCAYLWEEHRTQLSKQSLDERYHTFAVAFLKRCYQSVLSQAFHGITEGLSCGFSGIYLTDSTSFQLPSHLSAFYQSGGGDTSGASVKLHQTLELLSFRLFDLMITDGKRNDITYWLDQRFEWGENNLWIADLGHFSWKVFSRIDQSHSYFLSRYKTGTVLFVRQAAGFEPLDIEQHVITACDEGGLQAVEVYLGKDKVKARLIVEAVPEQVKQQRLYKYRQLYQRQNKTRHWEMSLTKERLCSYNLYLTNAPEKQLKNQDVFLIYALRWQIELLFKIWKSLLFLDKVGQMNIFRFECFLYGRLLFILLSTELLAFIKNTLQEDDPQIEISEWKTIKLIKKNFTAFSKQPSGVNITSRRNSER